MTTKTIAELREERTQAYEAANQIQATADEENRDLTDEETNDFDGFMAMIAEADESIKAEEERQAEAQKRRERLASIGQEIHRSNGRKTRAGKPEQATQSRVESMKLAVEDDPRKGYRSPRAFMLDAMNAERGQWNSVRNVDALKVLEAQRLDPNSEPGYFLPSAFTPSHLQAAAGSDEHGVYTDPHGGFFVQPDFRPQPLRVEPEVDPIGPRVRMIPMSSPVVQIPARVDKTHTSSVSGGLTVSRDAETATGASSRQKYEMVRLEANKLVGVAFITEELMQDSPVSFAALVSDGFRDEFNSKLIQERLSGTGVGEFTGVNNANALVTVSKETNQKASTILYKNIIKMRARCWGYANAVWLANHDTLPQLMQMNQEVGTAGVPAWQPSARDGEPDRLLGRPIFFSEYPETVGTAGDIHLSNWREYLEGLYQPLQSAESIHVRFLANERAFRFTMRNAGSPWWSAALTPNKSSDTLSPFVRLAARS